MFNVLVFASLLLICTFPYNSFICFQVCEANHIAHEWSSQPTFKQGTYIGDLIIASSILLSGNNFSKIELMAKQMNLAMIGKSSYYKYQRYYCFPVIFNFWETLVERNCQDVLKRSVILLGMKSIIINLISNYFSKSKNCITSILM